MMWMKKLGKSFYHALEGLKYAVKTQRNIRIHIVMAALAIILAKLFHCSNTELGLIVLAIGLVIVTELINTAIEKTIDIITLEFHPLAKIAKDVAAGAVLFSAVISVIIAIVVFYDKIINLLF